MFQNTIHIMLVLTMRNILNTFVFSSSPDSLTTERNDGKTLSSNISPVALYKLIVPLLRCEASDVRDTAVQALGKINSDALK